MNNNQKSVTTAGLLGIFLGAVGAHNWYLGEKKKGIIHLCLFGVAILLILLVEVIFPATLSLLAYLSMARVIMILGGIGWMLLAGSAIWGLIEGILILTKGDAGLAAQGIPTVGTPQVQQIWRNVASAPTPSMGTVTQGAGVGSQAVGVGLQDTNGGTQAAGISAQAATLQATAPVKPVKQSMDPAKKKKIIMGSVIGAVAVVVVIVGVVIVSMLMRVDYGEAYRVAKELKPEVTAVYQNMSCTRVVDYVNSTYTRPADYNEYADNCLSAGSELNELLEKLGETAGVKRNKEIKEQYNKFSEGVSTALPNKDELEAKLKLYKAWHEFVYLSDDIKYTSADSAIQAAAAPLINSGNETLKAYGEGWQASVLAVTQAYRDYDNLSYSDPNKTSARVKYQDLQADHKNWVAANKPDISQLGGLSFDNNAKMYSEWTKLYNMIRETYQENYNSKSGDCSELFGEVYCE